MHTIKTNYGHELKLIFSSFTQRHSVKTLILLNKLKILWPFDSNFDPSFFFPDIQKISFSFSLYLSYHRSSPQLKLQELSAVLSSCSLSLLLCYHSGSVQTVSRRQKLEDLMFTISEEKDKAPQSDRDRGNLSISQSSPNLANEPVAKEGISLMMKRSLLALRQSTLPTVSERHISFQRSLSHKLDLSNVEFFCSQPAT